MNKKENKKKKRLNKKYVYILIVSIIIIFIISMIIINVITANKSNNKTEDNNAAQKLDQMVNYDYYLDDNATEYYKKLYNELKIVLNKEEVNDEEYAKIVSKLFITDLFTLDNKITSSDIGGLQFVYPEFKENFVNIAKTTLYSSVESNIYGDRNQTLPIVTNVDIINIAESTFNYGGIDHNSYVINIDISYHTDLGYPTNYTLTLIKNDKYFQVVTGN